MLLAIIPFAQAHDLTTLEITQLPRFCWGQFVQGAKAPEFNIPAGCGVAMNHYCYGLVDLARGKRTYGNIKERITRFKLAKVNIVYTINSMANFPACPIRAHVENALTEVNGLLMGLGQK